MLPSVPQELMDAADRRGNSAYGSAYAFYSAALSFGMMAGPVASGMLAGYPGLGTALILAAIGLLTYALLFAIVVGLRDAKIPTVANALQP